MVNGQRVLVVDGLQEIQEVLQAVLGPRGLQVDWIRSHTQVHPGDVDRPDILVIDADAIEPQRSDKNQSWRNVPRVILGADSPSSDEPSQPQHAYVNKPYLFPELIQAIERLLPKRAA